MCSDAAPASPGPSICPFMPVSLYVCVVLPRSRTLARSLARSLSRSPALFVLSLFFSFSRFLSVSVSLTYSPSPPPSPSRFPANAATAGYVPKSFCAKELLCPAVMFATECLKTITPSTTRPGGVLPCLLGCLNSRYTLDCTTGTGASSAWERAQVILRVQLPLQPAPQQPAPSPAHTTTPAAALHVGDRHRPAAAVDTAEAPTARPIEKEVHNGARPRGRDHQGVPRRPKRNPQNEKNKKKKKKKGGAAAAAVVHDTSRPSARMGAAMCPGYVDPPNPTAQLHVRCGHTSVPLCVPNSLRKVSRIRICLNQFLLFLSRRPWGGSVILFGGRVSVTSLCCDYYNSGTGGCNQQLHALSPHPWYCTVLGQGTAG